MNLLDHKNIIKLDSIWKGINNYFMILEYHAGYSLLDRIKMGKRIAKGVKILGDIPLKMDEI